MHLHIEANMLSLAFLSLLLFDMSKNNVSHSKRSRIIRYISIITITNIAVEFLFFILAGHEVGGLLFQLVLWLNSVIVPLLCLFWFFYGYLTVFHGKWMPRKFLIASSFPYAVYCLLTVCFGQKLFSSNPTSFLENATSRFVMLSLCIFYSCITIGMVLWKIKSVEMSKVAVICIFSVVVMLAILVQSIRPYHMFTNSAFAASILMTYLFLQNRKMTIDTLTGASNRTSLLKKLRNIQKFRGGGHLVIVSLDDFKFVNQTFGQENSDAILRIVANYLSMLIRKGVVYRYNGDEFALVLTKQQNNEVKQIVDTILERFNKMWSYNQIVYMLSASIAVVPFPASFTTAEQLISAADFTVYQAKVSGKKRAVYFDDKLMHELNRRHDVECALKRAIDEDRFEVYYQPIFNIKDNTFEYAEALLRLTDPELGVLSPSEFIPIAEKSGMIIEITYIVFEKVIQCIKEIQEKKIPLKSVAINLSAVNFMQKDLTNRIISLVNENKIDTSCIRLELTEGILIDSFDNVKEVMNFLAEKGVVFALDDFGEGYSNISYLLNLPFVSVKIDRSIVSAETHNYVLLDSVITMLRKLGKKVVAEGVETQEQNDILNQLSCDYIQGYLYAKPMPKNDLIALLSDVKKVIFSS